MLRTWADWDEAPANIHRVHAFSDACQTFAGAAANDLRKSLAAGRRAGMTYKEALDAWEGTW
jgi:hypothetical protein